MLLQTLVLGNFCMILVKRGNPFIITDQQTGKIYYTYVCIISTPIYRIFRDLGIFKGQSPLSLMQYIYRDKATHFDKRCEEGKCMWIFLIDFYDRLNDTGVPFKDRFPLNYQLHFVKKEQQIRSVQVQEQKILIYLSL